jgi:hypothetical protein
MRPSPQRRHAALLDGVRSFAGGPLPRRGLFVALAAAIGAPRIAANPALCGQERLAGRFETLERRLHSAQVRELAESLASLAHMPGPAATTDRQAVAEWFARGATPEVMRQAVASISRRSGYRPSGLRYFTAAVYSLIPKGSKPGRESSRKSCASRWTDVSQEGEPPCFDMMLPAASERTPSACDTDIAPNFTRSFISKGMSVSSASATAAGRIRESSLDGVGMPILEDAGRIGNDPAGTPSRPCTPPRALCHDREAAAVAAVRHGNPSPKGSPRHAA